VVALPEKAKSADEWMQKHGRAPVTIEAEPASGV
jgi:hypothetical protein